jgi:hypothetical protein
MPTMVTIASTAKMGGGRSAPAARPVARSSGSCSVSSPAPGHADLRGCQGRLAYYNEPAEPLLGVRFDAVGPMDMADWLAAFRPGDQ